MFSLPVTILFTLGWTLQKVNAGNTICTSNHTDWYTSVIGETPCTTYERLRQICNTAYQVGTLTRNMPPDHCDDQVQDCCCNSISFNLSMLCLACQDNSRDGFDAGTGTYEQYLLKDGINTCNPRTDRSFIAPIQSAVCNSGIKIEDQFYDRIWWGGGDWWYGFTRDFIISQHIGLRNKTQTKCDTVTSPQPPRPLSTYISLISTKTTPTLATTSGGPSSSSGDNINATNGPQLGSGPIAGIAIGVVVIVALLVIIFTLLLRRHRTRTIAARLDTHPYPYNPNSAGTAGSQYGSSSPVSVAYMLDRGGMATSAVSGLGSGHTAQGSSTTVGANHEFFAWPAGRHTDAGPVPGASLSRSGSGRLPPAYGEQFTPVRPMFQATEVRGQSPLLEMGVRDGSDGTLMREVGNHPQEPNINPLVS